MTRSHSGYESRCLPASFEIKAAERITKRLGMSRSQLYARAVEAFVKSYRGGEIREALEAVYGSEPAAVDPVIDSLQAEALREEWERAAPVGLRSSIRSTAEGR